MAEAVSGWRLAVSHSALRAFLPTAYGPQPTAQKYVTRDSRVAGGQSACLHRPPSAVRCSLRGRHA